MHICTLLSGKPQFADVGRASEGGGGAYHIKHEAGKEGTQPITPKITDTGKAGRSATGSCHSRDR